jgi:hypothetical protein
MLEPELERASSMIRIGKYTAGMMMANATGNAASRPTPPRISQVSLPSQKGPIEFITVSRCEGCTRPCRMPTPRSKPSRDT